MRLQDGKGIEVPRWAPNEIVASGDISFVSQSTYQNLTDLLASLAEQGVATGSTKDKVVAGLLLEWTSSMNCLLRTGAAVSYSGAYFTGSAWGFAAVGGNVFSAFIGQDTLVAFDVGAGGDRYDTVQIRPAYIPYDSSARNYKDPITRIITSALTFTKIEFGVEVAILKGTPGAGIAPTHTAGWIKIAEVLVHTADTAIDQSHIKDVRNSATWTTEASATIYSKVHATGVDFVSDFMFTVLDDLSSAAARLTLGVGVENYSVLPGASVAAGQVVTLDDNGYVRRFRQAVIDVSFRSASPTGMYLAAPLDDTHFVLCYLVVSTSHWWAVVVTVDFTASPPTLSYGTPVDCGFAVGLNFGASLCPLDSTHVLFCNVNAGITAFSARVISVSGTTPTWNSNVDLAETPTGSSFCALEKVDATHAIFAYTTSAPTTRVVFVIVSGTTPSWGTSVSLYAQATADFPQLQLDLVNNFGLYSANRSVALTNMDIGSFTWSGTTITARTSVTITDTPAGVNVHAFNASPGVAGPQEILLVASKGGSAGITGYYFEAIEGFTKSDFTGLTFEAAAAARRRIGNIVSGGVTGNTMCMRWINDRVGILAFAGGFNSGTAVFMIVARNGAKISATSKWRYTNALAIFNEKITMVRWKSNLVILTTGTGVAANGSMVALIEVGWDRIVGIVDGGGNIISSGIASGLSGLVKDSIYYVQSDGTLGITVTEMEAGKALSTTSLNVKLKSFI